VLRGGGPQIGVVGQLLGPSTRPFRETAFRLGLQPPCDAFDQVVLVARAGRLAEGFEVLAAALRRRHPFQFGDLSANIHRHDSSALKVSHPPAGKP